MAASGSATRSSRPAPIKAGAAALREWLSARDYKIFEAGINLLAVHRSDPILPHMR
jgi:hypothetical protein